MPIIRMMHEDRKEIASAGERAGRPADGDGRGPETMSGRRQDRTGGRRATRRFRPWGWRDRLESRELLSGGVGVVASIASRAHAAGKPSHAARISPTAEINLQYAAFLADFRNVEQSYIESINSQSSSSVSVSATLTAPYTVTSTLMQVDNASVFGPDGAFGAPVAAVATVNGIPVGTFVLTGRAGNTLILDPNQLPPVSLNAGVLLVANVPATSQSSAAAIFPTYIANRTAQMGISLVTYFNGIPLKLPYFNAPPHTPNQRGAIQSYVYQQVAGSSATSLAGSLSAITLPTTAGSDLKIYDAAVAAAVEQSRLMTLNGVRQIYAGKLRVPAPAPANRLGINFHTSGGGSGGGGTATSGGTTAAGA